MDSLQRIAELRLEEAVARGDFDDLPLAGKPLELEDLSRVPGDLRASYLLLRGAGVLPEEMEMRKELLRLEHLVRACEDAGESAALRRRRDALRLRYALAVERRGARR